MFKIVVIVLLVLIIGLQLVNFYDHYSLSQQIEEVDTRVFNHDQSQKFDTGTFPGEHLLKKHKV